MADEAERVEEAVVWEEVAVEEDFRCVEESEECHFAQCVDGCLC